MGKARKPRPHEPTVREVIDDAMATATQKERTRCLEILISHEAAIDGHLFCRLCNLIRGGRDIREASCVGDDPDDTI